MEDEAIVVEFIQNKTTLWTLNYCLKEPLPENNMCQDKQVVFTGPGPAWMYMLGSCWALAGGACCIQVWKANRNSPDGEITVFPQQLAESQFIWYRKHAAELYTEILINRGDLTREIIGDIPGLIEDCNENLPILITGSQPMWLSAALAIEATARGRVIWYKTPKEDGVYQFPTVSFQEMSLPRLPRPGIRVGIVGDPNSGKSVFSFMLDKACLNAGLNVWRYDCDAAARTSFWYLQMSRDENSVQANKIRKNSKREWNKDLERQVAAELSNLSQEIPLIIADLPGGKHFKDQDPELSERIPDGREVIMAEIDAFIIIGKTERDSGRLWRKALAERGYTDKIFGELTSVKPESEPHLSLKELEGLHFDGEISGLNRETDLGRGAQELAPIADMLALLERE
jgi:hypothetical protein